jgi:hypothetical protein
MTFLQPSLWGALLPLLALPVVIHLLNKGFPQYFKFPTVELIKETLAQRSRLHRWRHWLLLLLRTAFLALLLMAFLLPVWKRFGLNPVTPGGRHVLIVLDHSVSMEHKGSGPTSRERAVQAALDLLESLGPEDRLNVVLMEDNPSSCFVDFSDNYTEAKRFLGALKPGLRGADVNRANALAARLIGKGVSRPEVYYLSDFQRKNWANANFTSLPLSVKLFFVEVGPAVCDNRAILDARLDTSLVLAGETARLEITLGNYSAEPFTGRVTVNLDRRFQGDKEVSMGPWSELKTTVPIAVGGPGVHLCEVLLPPDALVYDNRYCLALTVQEKEEVLIVTDAADPIKGGAYFLKMALNPFEREAGSLLPRLISSRELTSTRLAGVHKMFFTQLAPLSDEAAAATAQFLVQGGGLIYFLDGLEEVANLAKLEKAMGSNPLPLRLSQRRSATNVTSGAQQVVRGDFRSPYLKVFQGVARQNLGLLEFYDYYQASPTGREGILLVYGDESPALAAWHQGRGTLLLLNFSASEFSSNLARQRIFPAWMQELVKAVSADEAPPSAYTIGETLHTEVWRHELRDQDFLNPSGQALLVKRELVGQRYRVAFTTDQLGFYTLGTPRPLYAFGINTSREEADLRPLEKAVLPTQFANQHDAHFVAGREDFDELAKGRPIFHWFILGAMVFLLLETGFQFLLRKGAT